MLLLSSYSKQSLVKSVGKKVSYEYFFSLNIRTSLLLNSCHWRDKEEQM